MRRAWLFAVLALTLLGGAAASARAQGSGSSATAVDATAVARARTQTATKAVTGVLADRAALLAQKATLQKRYDGQLGDVDALKQKRASWYRDRQLREAMASSLETADKLAAIAAKVRAIDVRLKSGRTELVAAIDAELAGAGAGLDDARLAQLGKLRREQALALRPPGKKIVLPDDRIDPLADPEELDQQVAALAQSERQLAKEVASLERQATRFERMDALRDKHQRADELDGFDDDQPRRSTGHGGKVEATAALGDNDDGAGAGAEAPPPPSPPFDMFDNDPVVVLSDVVDAETIGALRKAEQSDDPGVKAKAATRAAKKVEERLRKLRTQRTAVEQRARTLRGE